MAEAAHSKSAAELEAQWYRDHYRGDMRQLSVRSVVMGAILGAVMSLSNLYIGLKTGWGFGVAITACVLSFAIWKTLAKMRLVKSDMTVLENNAMQSTASSAGYSTGGTLVSAIAAYLLLNGHHIPYGLLTLWIFFLAVLGVTMAIPMKRQMINVERLRFPSGIAAAMTLRSLHADHAHHAALEGPPGSATAEIVKPDEVQGALTSAEEGEKSAQGLFYAGAVGAVVAFLRDGFSALFDMHWISKPITVLQAVYPVFGQKALQYTIGAEGSVLLFAGGALMGIRVAVSVMIGSILCWAVLVPRMYEMGVIQALEYRTMVAWSLWGGASCMVTSGLLAFGLQWRAVVRAMSGLTAIFAPHKAVAQDEFQKKLDAIEVPSSWMAVLGLVGAVGVIWIAHSAFSIKIWMGTLAVILSFFLALVACRVCGETDTTPVGAMGKVTQLTYGILAPRQTNTNLMAACITAGVADSASDLLTDLKSGYVLGANPRKQFLAQFVGIFIGTAITVPSFYLLVPRAESLGTAQWPAPAAQVWAGVARLLANGFESLHPTARWAILIGGLTGIVLVLLPRWLPAKLHNWVPSPMGLGLAFTFHFYYGLSMFLGGLAQWILAKKAPKLDQIYTAPVASGLIAGESLMGVFLILLPLAVAAITGHL
ncbi:MAG: OPT family oligopeptide transporter [bacterium]